MRRYTPDRLRQMRRQAAPPWPPEICHAPGCETAVADGHAFCQTHFLALPRNIRDRVSVARSRWVQSGRPTGYADANAAYLAAVGWARRTLRRLDGEQE